MWWPKLEVQNGQYNKPAGCSTSVACRGRPQKQTKTQEQKSVDVLSSYRYGSTIYLCNITIINKPKSTTNKQSNLFLYDPTYLLWAKEQEASNQEK
jgi:hypothetical protein